MSPGLMFFHRTFLYLQVFISSWYLSRFDAACNLAFSAASSSTYRYSIVVAAILVRKEPNLSSSSMIASSPYRRRKRVNPVVQVCEMLWPQTEVINSCAHFPFGKSNNALDTTLKIRPFALSTTPLLSGWLTVANASLIPNSLQKFLNSALSLRRKGNQSRTIMKQGGWSRPYFALTRWDPRNTGSPSHAVSHSSFR